jgi:hypothetical protein
VAALFSSLIPYGIIWLGVRRGRLTDHHIRVRRQWRTPLLLGLASVVAGLILLVLLDAPRQLTAMVTVMLAVLLGIAVVNQMWKLSAHAAVSTGSITVLVMVFGPWLMPAAALIALVGWSRVQLRDHTTSQVIAGALAGTVLAAGTFSLAA